MGKLVDIVGFTCQFAKYIRIRLADALYYCACEQYGADKFTE